jgi:hypothetical protein
MTQPTLVKMRYYRAKLPVTEIAYSDPCKPVENRDLDKGWSRRAVIDVAKFETVEFQIGNCCDM